MPTVQIKANLSTDDLMQAVKQLGSSELEKFVWSKFRLSPFLSCCIGYNKSDKNLLIFFSPKRFDILFLMFQNK